MNTDPRYSMLIRWSDEDQAYLVTLPEWQGHLQNWQTATHGKTYAEAVERGREVLEMLIEAAQAYHIAHVGVAGAMHRAAAQASETLRKVRVRERRHRIGGVIRRRVPAGAPALR
jgi:predicted RNase H-like HicB family nuclease